MDPVQEFKPGTIVKFAKPMDQNELDIRFVVLELRGPRVLLEAIVAMNIKPQEVHNLEDLVCA